jgi:hypothetical protein
MDFDTDDTIGNEIDKLLVFEEGFKFQELVTKLLSRDFGPYLIPLPFKKDAGTDAILISSGFKIQAVFMITASQAQGSKLLNKLLSDLHKIKNVYPNIQPTAVFITAQEVSGSTVLKWKKMVLEEFKYDLEVFSRKWLCHQLSRPENVDLIIYYLKASPLLSIQHQILINNSETYKRLSKLIYDLRKSKSIDKAIPQLEVVDSEISVYSTFNEDIITFLRKMYDSDFDTTYTEIACADIAPKLDHFLHFIISQESRDFIDAFSSLETPMPVYCLDSSLERIGLSFWDEKQPYGNLVELSGRLLSKLSPSDRKHERIYILFNPTSLAMNSLQLRKVHRIMQQQCRIGVDVYCVKRSALPIRVGEIYITDQVLDFHVIPGRIVDVMDANTLLSYRFTTKNKDGTMIVSAFEELFENIRGLTTENANGFKVGLGWEINELKNTLLNCRGNMDADLTNPDKD